MKIWQWSILTLGGIACCVLALWGGGIFWGALQNDVTAPAATALGSVIGTVAAGISAVAGAVAAFAALRAASESNQTAKHAVEALGLAMEPVIGAHLEERQIYEGNAYRHESALVVKNESRWAASKVEIRIVTADGREGRFRIAYLPPATQTNPTIKADPTIRSFFLDLPRANPYQDSEWRGEAEVEDKIVIDYSDERGFLKWRKTIRYVHSYFNSGDMSGGGSEYADETKRIR